MTTPNFAFDPDLKMKVVLAGLLYKDLFLNSVCIGPWRLVTTSIYTLMCTCTKPNLKMKYDVFSPGLLYLFFYIRNIGLGSHKNNFILWPGFLEQAIGLIICALTHNDLMCAQFLSQIPDGDSAQKLL